MAIIHETPSGLYPASVTKAHPERSVWIEDLATTSHQLRIDGNVVGAYGTKKNGKPFVEGGEADMPSAEKLSIHMRNPNATEQDKKCAISALALSLWQVTY